KALGLQYSLDFRQRQVRDHSVCLDLLFLLVVEEMNRDPLSVGCDDLPCSPGLHLRHAASTDDVFDTQMPHNLVRLEDAPHLAGVIDGKVCSPEQFVNLNTI